ncbi:protogenin A-like [Saccoglossus kowalevskii]|uniref:Protogenin A-like n=1 Tax=Saccoglossus kowalevskii TaxID=10224 RepID=A0ABM0LWB2_SACKO|nr:PREDICTED: protogenin A-like [Saccoglossus kowalevskii]
MAIQPSEAKPWMLLLFCGLFSSVLCAKDLEFTVELNNAAVVKGSSFIWDCAAEGALPIDITWRKDGQAIVNSEQHTILRNGSLYFTTIERKKQDEGVYECVASNIYGTIVSRANLFIASMSRFLEDPQPVTASLKGVARFRCYLDSIPQADISWEKDRLPIPFNNRFVVLPSGVLQIHDIQESDAANYRCIAVNIANKRRSAEAPLTVQSTIPLLDDVDDMRKPRLVSRSGSTQALAGKTVILECLFERYSLQDTPPEVTWTRGGQLLYTNKYSVYGRSNLRISDLVVFDSGTYVCTARNVETNGIVSVNIYLNVQAPPTLDMVPNGVTRPRASTARFTCICTVDSKPTPTITWLKDGRKIDISGRFNIIYDGLVIVNVQKNTGNETDEGLYQCIAENMYGRAQASARLIIEVAENSPNPPRNVAATVLSSTSVNVTWQAPIMNITVDILTYTIHYQLMEKSYMSPV